MMVHRDIKKTGQLAQPPVSMNALYFNRPVCGGRTMILDHSFSEIKLFPAS